MAHLRRDIRRRILILIICYSIIVSTVGGFQGQTTTSLREMISAILSSEELQSSACPSRLVLPQSEVKLPVSFPRLA